MNAVVHFRSAQAVLVIGLGGLVLSGCWGWIPESPEAQPQAPAIPGAAASRPSGAAAETEPAWYAVVSGDTLFSIAWRFRLRVADLAAWNNLGDGSLILVGQRLRLASPAGRAVSTGRTAPDGSRSATPPKSGRKATAAARSTPQAGGRSGSSPASPARRAAGRSNWRWPTAGRVDAKSARVRSGDFGIRIMGRRGQEIHAADRGKVMYAGDGLKAYGLLVIVQHSPAWISAYGHNDKILVREGEEVRAGQAIATMGMGPGNAAMLHFEIRRDGRPVESIGLLPPGK